MGREFRRGFKAEVERTVVDIRADFRKTPLDPLDPIELARHLCIPVLTTSDLPDDLAGRFRSSRMRAKFHAATFRVGTAFVIIHNDAMPVTRQRSNIAHELGHIFLEHDHPPINVDDEFTRDAADEAEANWFGFALLVPEPAAAHLARIGFTISQAAEMFGVSEDLMRMRLDVTGARKRFPQSRRG